MMQVITKSLTAVITVLFIFGCERIEKPPFPAEDITVTGRASAVNADIIVVITANSASGYDFEYVENEFSDRAGNLDFRTSPAKGHPVLIRFAIDQEKSVDGIKFVSNGADAIWIALATDTGPEGSPERTYDGDQFFNFATEANNTKLHVSDRNDDGEDYRYALRFTLNGVEIVDDPDIKNDSR